MSGGDLESSTTPSGARLLRGGPLAAELRRDVAADVVAFRRRHGYLPALTVVIVGRDPGARLYLNQILRTASTVGIPGRMVDLPARATATDLARELASLDADPLVAGVIVQMPLPRRIPLRTVIDTLRPVKDIDGVHPLNIGLMTMGFDGFLPACGEAAVAILKRSGYVLDGLRAAVVGRSNVVGKPVQILLVRENCTVTVCHTHTRDLGAVLRESDVVVVSAGSAGLVTGDMLKPGALVVDVGINVVPGGIVGDVDFASASRVAAALTPVPGGVGPLTNAILMEHLVRAAYRQARDGNATDRFTRLAPPIGHRARRAAAHPSPRLVPLENAG